MNYRGKSQFSSEALSQLLDRKTHEIHQNWLASLEQQWGDGSGQKLRFITRDCRHRKDLFSLLKQILEKGEVSVADIYPILSRIGMGSDQYALLDFFHESTCLESSIEAVLRSSQEIPKSELIGFLDATGQKLHAIGDMVLQCHADLSRCVIDQGARGYVQVDHRGRIIYANQKFKDWLELEKVQGLLLAQFFSGDDRKFIKKAHALTLQEPAGPRPLTLRYKNGKTMPVGAEVGPITLSWQRQGGYACLVDLSEPFRMQQGIFNRFPVGIIQTDSHEMLVFANQWILDFLPAPSWQGLSLWDLFPDETNQAIVRRQLKIRKKIKGGEYEAELTQTSGHRIPVKIYSTPVTDLNRKFTGSLAIIRSLERQRALEERQKALVAIAPHLAILHHWPDMLTKIAQELTQFIPYHFLSVSEVSKDRRHIRRLHSYSTANEKMEWGTRWLPVTERLVDWIQEHRTPYIISNLKAFFSQPQWQELEKIEEIQNLIKKFGSSLTFPVEKAGKIIGSVTLLHREEGVYNEKHRELLEALPLDKAVLLALEIDEDEKEQFHLKLIKKISSVCGDFQQIAEIIVDELADQYRWSNVSLFQADKELGLLRLLHQKAGDGEHQFPEGYQQPLAEGILGYVFRTGHEVSSGDVKEDPDVKNIVKVILEDTRSEICLPIETAEGFWLLNIEDTKKHAFSPEDLQTLKSFRDEIRDILERSWLDHSLKATLEATNDAIINTDWQGTIKKVNRAAAELLGYTETEMVGQSLAGYFQDKEVGKKTVTKRVILSIEAIWETKAGEPLKVLLSASVLPDPFRWKIFIAKNLADQEKADKLIKLEELSREVATQIKTPLSLVFGWLRLLQEEAASGSVADTLERIIRQLHKMDLTCDRLSLFDYDEKKGWVPFHEVLINSNELVTKVMDMLPKSEKKKIDLHSVEPMPYVRGDLFQLGFCLQTILSYLLRVIPEKKKIRLVISSQDDRLAMEIAGSFPSPEELEVSRTWTAMALGEETIRRFIANHKGTYAEPVRKGEKIIFRLELPIARRD